MARVPSQALAWAVVLVAGLVACSGPSGTKASTSPRPPSASSSSAGTPSAAELRAWRKCGAIEVPPADVLKMPTQIPKVVNRTGGAISDADAQKWVIAFMREQQIERWAETNAQDGLLTGGCLGSKDSTGQLFGSELQTSRTAQASGRKVEVIPARYASVTIVRLPDDVKANIKGSDGTPSDYALVIEVQGPGGTYLVDLNGNRTPVDVIQPSEHFWTFLGGQYADSVLGPVWFQDSLFNCLTAWLRTLCGI